MPVALTNEGPANPALANVQQQAQRPVFDPFYTASRMVGLGIPSAAIAQALAELGLTPEQAGVA